MTFRVLVDGAIETDSAEEAVKLARAMKGAAPQKSTPPAVAGKCRICGKDCIEPPHPDAELWAAERPGVLVHAKCLYPHLLVRTDREPQPPPAWDPSSGTWYFPCACGQRRENSGISAGIEGAQCSRCGTRADRPDPSSEYGSALLDREMAAASAARFIPSPADLMGRPYEPKWQCGACLDWFHGERQAACPICSAATYGGDTWAVERQRAHVEEHSGAEGLASFDKGAVEAIQAEMQELIEKAPKLTYEEAIAKTKAGGPLAAAWAACVAAIEGAGRQSMDWSSLPADVRMVYGRGPAPKDPADASAFVEDEKRVQATALANMQAANAKIVDRCTTKATPLSELDAYAGVARRQYIENAINVLHDHAADNDGDFEDGCVGCQFPAAIAARAKRRARPEDSESDAGLDDPPSYPPDPLPFNLAAQEDARKMRALLVRLLEHPVLTSVASAVDVKELLGRTLYLTCAPQPDTRPNPYDAIAKPVRADHPALKEFAAGSVAAPVRVATIAGEHHITGTDCCIVETCGAHPDDEDGPCVGRRHMAHPPAATPETLCEVCDASEWVTPTAPSADASAEVDTPAWWASFREKNGRDPTAKDMGTKARIGVPEGTKTIGVAYEYGIVDARPRMGHEPPPAWLFLCSSCGCGTRAAGICDACSDNGGKPPPPMFVSRPKDIILLCEGCRQIGYPFHPYEGLDNPTGIPCCEACLKANVGRAHVATAKVFLSGVIGTGLGDGRGGVFSGRNGAS